MISLGRRDRDLSSYKNTSGSLPSGTKQAKKAIQLPKGHILQCSLQKCPKRWIEKERLSESRAKSFGERWIRESTPGGTAWASSREISYPIVSVQHLSRRTSEWAWISKTLNSFFLFLHRSVNCVILSLFRQCMLDAWGVGGGRWITFSLDFRSLSQEESHPDLAEMVRPWCYDWMRLWGGVLRISIFSKSVWPREWSVVHWVTDPDSSLLPGSKAFAI